MTAIATDLDGQIEFIKEKVAWLLEHSDSIDVIEIYKAILESLCRLKYLEK